MNKIIAALLFSASTYGFAGGSIGGGSGSGIMLELQRAEISREDFSRLVVAGMQNEGIAINRLPARVKAVNFQARSVEVELDGVAEPLTLKSPDVKE